MKSQGKYNDQLTGTIFFLLLFLLFSLSVSGDRATKTFSGKINHNREVQISSDDSGSAVIYELQYVVSTILNAGSPSSDLVPRSDNRYYLREIQTLTTSRINSAEMERLKVLPFTCWKEFFLLSYLHGDNIPLLG